MTGNNEVSVAKRESTLPAMQTVNEEEYVSPSTDVYETPDAFVLMIDLPGSAKESISVTLENLALSVKAKIESYHRQEVMLLFNELRSSMYYRVFNLGDGIDRNNIDAHYEDGVLTLKLFKRAEVRPREIRIK